MKISKHPKLILFLIFTILTLLFPKISSAHPGNTASDGCHYCRTNCDYWGEVYGERHCHGGGYNYNYPTTLPTTPKPTPKPTSTNIPTRISSPKPIISPTPDVKGETADGVMTPGPTNSPSQTTPGSLTAGEIVIILGFLGVLVGIPVWIFYQILRKIRRHNNLTP